MYVEGRFQWYMFCEFLCISVLDDEEHDEYVMNVRVLVFQNSFDLHEPCLHAFFCFSFMHWTTSASTWLFDWSSFACRATSLNETARFIKLSAIFKSSLGSIPSQSISHICFCIFSHLCYTWSCYFIHAFLFFFFLKKFITQKILIQFTWGFLHNDLHDVFYFLSIFPEFVLGWKLF